jgi:hypothetical protein
VGCRVMSHLTHTLSLSKKYILTTAHKATHSLFAPHSFQSPSVWCLREYKRTLCDPPQHYPSQPYRLFYSLCHEIQEDVQVFVPTSRRYRRESTHLLCEHSGRPRSAERFRKCTTLHCLYSHTCSLSLSPSPLFVPTENAVRNTSLISSATRCRWNRPKSGSTSSTTGPTTSFLSLARSSNGTAVSSVQFSTHTHFHLLLRNLFAVYSLFTQCASGPRLAG